MDQLTGFEQWKDLFDESVSKVWKEESAPILKNVSVMIFIINREFERIRKTLNGEVLNLKKSIELNSKTEEIITNKQLDIEEEKECQKESISLSNKSYNDSGSIIISDEDVPKLQKVNCSPEIKRMHKQRDLKRHVTRKRKLENNNVKSTNKLGELNQVDSIKDTSSKENDSSLDFLRYMSTHKSGKDPKHIKNVQPVIATPPKADSFDVSIVQCTPTPVSKLLISKKYLHVSKKQDNTTKANTLTQMFMKQSENKCQESNSKFTPRNSEDLFGKTDNDIEIMSEEMGITNMVSYLNNDCSKTENKNKCLESNTEEIENLLASIKYEDFQDDTSLNSAILYENQGDNEDVPKDLNEFLADAQDVPQQLEAAPVVRGKARQQLPAWSCKDCERFYTKQGLKPEEILALNKKCSKHRGYYRPREDTLPGYWDMNMSDSLNMDG